MKLIASILFKNRIYYLRKHKLQNVDFFRFGLYQKSLLIEVDINKKKSSFVGNIIFKDWG